MRQILKKLKREFITYEVIYVLELHLCVKYS